MIIPGAMAELPFGDNPFSAPSSETEHRPRPTASFLATQTIPPATTNTSKAGKSLRKRDKATAGVVIPQGEANKKGKRTETVPETIFSSFSDLARENFKAESINDWKQRGAPEADFCLRQAIGEVYVHGLNRLNAKDKEIADLKAVVAKFQLADGVHKQEVFNLKKSAEDKAKLHKKEVEKLQAALDEAKSDLRSEEELHNAAFSSLQAKFDEVNAEKRKELSEAYSQGFLGYLRSFLGAHPDYDWSLFFPPSTVKYMEQFKVDNAEAINLEKAKLASKLQAEMAKISADEASKGEADIENHPEGEKAQTEADVEASPSHTTAAS